MDETIVLQAGDFAEMQVREPPKRKSELYKEIVEYSLEGTYLRTWECASQAAKHYKVSLGSIYNICKGNYLYSKNTSTIFTYRGEDITERLSKIDRAKIQLSPQASSCREVCEYTLGGKFLFKWPAFKLAAKANNVSPHAVSNCCRGRRLFVDKKIFLFPDGDIKQRVKEVKAELYRLSKRRPKYRGVDEYTLDGKFVKGYPSASAASKELNIHVSDITRCCNGEDKIGKRYTTKGRIFLWIGDSISERLELIKQNRK